MDNTPFYLCSGFHRSGTSLLAATLAHNGVNMGENLMGASFANPRGHVEDLPMVQIHDSILNVNATDWRYYGERPLTVSEVHLARLKEYIVIRKQLNTSQPYIGGKDPRAVFFLDAWNRATEGHLKTILVFRDWRYSVSSLLKRHSRELLQFTTAIEKRTTDFYFWKYPDLAAKMWLASAQEMLKWLKLHPHDTFLFEQNAFTARQQEIKNVAAQKGIPAEILHCESYEQELMQTSVPQSMLEMVSPYMQKLCFEMQDKLYEHADVISESHFNVAPPDLLVNKVGKQIEAGSKHVLVPDSLISVVPDLTSVSIADAVKLISTYDEALIASLDWQILLNRNNVKADEYEKLCTLATKYGEFEVAKTAIQKALKIKPAPWRFMQFGDLLLRQGELKQAASYYKQALDMAPENATFYARMAEIEALNGQFQKAQELIEQAVTLEPAKPAIKQAKARLMLESRRTLGEQHHSSSLAGLMVTLSDYQKVVDVMSNDFEVGKKLDDYMVQSAFLLRDNKRWLIQGSEKLSAPARNCLIDYLIKHLRKYWPEAVIKTELLDSSFAELFEGAILNLKEDKSLPSIGVSLHAFYPELLPELMTFVEQIPNLKKIVITCPPEVYPGVAQTYQYVNSVDVVQVENKGRDVLPWLTVAPLCFSDCELVLKLHTKATPHADDLVGWRLQLLWLLIGDEGNARRIINAFSQQPDLGLVIPNYHPKLSNAIDWGKNYTIAKSVAGDLHINVPENLQHFPAGSMFWYRPKALTRLLERPWKASHFPQESKQIDGTIMHAIERLIAICAIEEGYKVKYSQDITFPELSHLV